MFRKLIVAVSIAGLGCGQTSPDRTLDPPTRQTYAASVCPSFSVEDPTQVVLASVQGAYGAKQELVFVRADGSKFVGATFGADRAETGSYIYISDIEVVVQDGHILAHRGDDGAVLFNRLGVEIEREQSREAMRPTLVERGLWSLIDVVDGWNVFGKPTAGRVPVDKWTETAGRVIGWMDPATLEVQPVVVAAGIDVSKLIWTGEAFSGISVSGGVASLVRVSSNETRLSPIPGYAGKRYMRIKESKGQWAHLWSYDEDREWIANLHSGDVHAITKKPPPGFERFQPDSIVGTTRIDLDLAEDGGLLGTFRDASSAGRFHSPDGAENWVRLADPVTQVRSVYGWKQTGTQVVVALEMGAGTNTPIAPWEAPPPGIAPPLAGTSTQLARAGVTHVLPQGASLPSNGLSRSGLCAAYMGPDDQGKKQVSILDVGTGTTSRVDEIAPWGAFWIE